MDRKTKKQLNEILSKINFKWFVAHYQEICDEYGNAYVVIKDKKVIGSYKSYNAAVEETSKTEETGTFIIQRCDPKERAYEEYVFNGIVL